MTDFKHFFKVEHGIWTTTLLNYFKLADGSLTEEHALDDKWCPLGEWIYTDGVKYASYPEYSKLKDLHQLYHQISADMVKRLNQGEKLDKTVFLGRDSKFDKVALELAGYILILQRKVNQAEATVLN